MISSSESINISPEPVSTIPEPVSTIPEPVVSTSKPVNPSSEPKNLMCKLQIGLNIAAIVALILASIKYFLDIKNHYKKQKSKTTTISTSKKCVNITSESAISNSESAIPASEPVIPSSESAIPNSEPVISSSEPADSKPANLTSESVNSKSEPKTSLIVEILTLVVTILMFLFERCDRYYDKQREEIIQPAKSAEVDAARKRERYLVGGKRKIGNLIWSDRSLNTMDWFSAKEYCEDLSEGGFNDWRLPNIDELRTTIKNCYKTETDGLCKVSEKNECLSFINCWYPEGTCYCDVRLDDYSKLSDSEIKLWSSSSKERKPDSEVVWIVDSYNAGVILHDKLDNIYVRCVR